MKNADTLRILAFKQDESREKNKTGWIPCSEMLPENAKHKGAFCPKYLVNTKYGVTEGWYNPDRESWYVLMWFMTEWHFECDVNFEKGDVPRVIRVPENTEMVIAWQPLPEPWEGDKE